jgi:PAS domain S-box-containing protein
MKNARNQRSEDEHQFVAADTFYNSERLLQTFSQTTGIGFAILDDKLRYQAINKCLASINGIPAEAHLRFTTRDIFGEISEKIAEARYHRVLSHGETSHFEVKDVVLPTRPGSRFWGLNTNFPIRDRTGRVQQIAVMVVDVTEQRRLEVFFCKLATELRHTNTREIFWLARELQSCIDQYHSAITLTLKLLIGKSQRSEASAEELSQSIAGLEGRLLEMRKLVSEIAKSLPIEQQA